MIATSLQGSRARHIYLAHVDIVHGCQLRCIGCPNSTLLPKVKQVDPEDFGAILANIDVEHIRTLRLFNYGEPLLHKRLSEILAKIPQQQWRASIVEISTNAQKVYWDDFEEAIRLEVLNRLVVSCDGDGTPEKYERLRPPSKWEKLIEFLERARELRDRYAPAMQLITRNVVESKADMEAWNEILLPRGWTPEFRGWKILPEAAENPTGRKPEIPPGVCFFMAPPDAFQNPWYGEVRQLYVDWDGTVVPCCMHPMAGILGNLKSHTFNEILKGTLRNQFIESLETRRHEMKICGECEIGPPGAEGPSFSSPIEDA